MSDFDIPKELPFPDDESALPPAPTVLAAEAPLSTDTKGGWCPFAIKQSTPNFWVGNSGRKAVVDHVTAASWQSVVSWFRNPASQRSAHFQVRKDGTIDQFVSIEDSAWANGASYVGGRWVDPQGHIITPTWPGMTPPTNPNRTTVSVEHEGFPGEAWTAAQKAADTRLDQWLAAQFGAFRPYVARVNLIGHYAISPVTKPNCPGPLVDLAERAAAANAATPQPPPDPLKAKQLPGAVRPMYCGTGFYDFYYADDRGFSFFGYALTDEARDTGQDGRSCTWMRLERALLKYVEGDGVRLALLDEAVKREWLPCDDD